VSETKIPESGQAVLVRRRPAVVRDVEPSKNGPSTIHRVEVEYLDGWNHPPEDNILWELERDAAILTRAGLPRIDDPQSQPDPPDLLGAFTDALRWSSIPRIPGLTGSTEALVSPWRGAIDIEPYQLEPVLRAIEMPRVSLLLADDVGLGKTIEAGLVLTELIVRRRIRRVLIVAPASLQLQWKDEMASKFSLEFAVIDRQAITDLQREYGMDANPWVITPRAITSMDFLRQPDILQQFLAGARNLDRGQALPWDLLIVDEAHNLAPQGFTERSDRCQMLGDIAPLFEHKVFLTATPHNGFTHSFSGLMELLDPVRFSQTTELSGKDHTQLEVIMVRRMKSQLNKLAEEQGQSKPFPDRHVEGWHFDWSPDEQTLSDALTIYRGEGRSLMGDMSPKERRVGRFIFSLLTKRLLSSPYSFAKTWWQHIEGFTAAEAAVEEVEVARRKAESTTSDDEEKSLREEDAAKRGGSWLRKHGEALKSGREGVSSALRSLGWTPQVLVRQIDSEHDFPDDGKWRALMSWINEHLLIDGDFTDQERLIIFTEYKDTYDYLLARFSAEGFGGPQVRGLFGGSTLHEREEVKEAFNDPEDPLRILIATDVASEGLNLQQSCRYVFHYEIPWNPMRLEQRNGRVDRYGQARDVSAFHFTSKENPDIEFLDYVAKKVESVRDDLGSVGEVIDRSVDERFTLGGVTEEEIERRVETIRKTAPERTDLAFEAPIRSRMEEAERMIAESSQRLGLRSELLYRLLSQATAFEGGRLGEIAADQTFRLVDSPQAWKRLVDENIRIGKGRQAGSMPALTFSTEIFHKTVGDRTVFCPRSETRLLRLSHPLMQKAVMTLRRQAWQPDARLSRWTVGLAEISQPLVRLHLLLQATNELREMAHEEVLILTFDSDLQEQDTVDVEVTALGDAGIKAWTEWWKGRWGDLAGPLDKVVQARRTELEAQARELLAKALETSKQESASLYKSRLAELSKSKGQAAIERLRKQLEKAEREALQRSFDPDEQADRDARVRQLAKTIEEEEFRRIRVHQDQLKRRLEAESDRTVKEVLPKRFSLTRLDLSPMAVELMVPTERPS
jgi:ERCC4-related helicase